MCARMQKCETTELFDYAYSVVWEGDFTGCKWSLGECTGQLKGDECVIVACTDGYVVCPPNCEHAHVPSHVCASHVPYIHGVLMQS